MATMGLRNRWVIGNWKMNGSLAGNAALLGAVAAAPSSVGKLGVCVPFPFLGQAQSALAGGAAVWGGQDVSEHASGAYTGQVSAAMLVEFGASLVLVGHSERRQYNAETSDLVARKASAALNAGVTPVICVGETLAEREDGHAEAVVGQQLSACREVLLRAQGAAILAYEPVWAIGTGKTATPAEAQAMHAFIRATLRVLGAEAEATSILYGGSVKAGNARELFSQADIDGGLIGGASLVAADFLAIAAAL